MLINDGLIMGDTVFIQHIHLVQPFAKTSLRKEHVLEIIYLITAKYVLKYSV